MPEPDPKRHSKPQPTGAGQYAAKQQLSPLQKKKLHELFAKLNKAIEEGYAPQALKKLAEISPRFPNNPNIHMITGKANAKLARHAESIKAYKRASELAPNEPEVLLNYAVSLHNGGEFDQALLQFERVLYLQPNHFNALRSKASLLTDLGRVQEGYELWCELVDRFKDTGISEEKRMAIALTGARFAPQLLDAQDAIERIETCVSNADNNSFKKTGYYEMGRLYQHLEQYDEAFDAYAACKQVDLVTEDWEPDEHSKRIDQLIDCWRTDESIAFSNAEGVDGSRLIFIVGMMRSGTSLTEQMLAQVEEIVPGGEMNAISRAIPKAETVSMRLAQRYPLDRSLYTQDMMNRMSVQAMAEYNDVHKQYTITDKQPYNYAFVPMIMHMFPGCKVIHCKRDPLDCCLSNFTQAFERLHLHTLNLYWLGRYYADYERTMNAWHEISGIEMIDLQYEDLVSDPEGQSRRVLEYLGREWTNEILGFHNSKRTVHTASRDQVRKPMYTSSVNKYKPFEHRLGELKRGIEDGRARPHGG